MDLTTIESDLQNPDFQFRLKAVTALGNYSAEVAVPLLIKAIEDPEFLVRSFVARELGKHSTPESFSGLLGMMKFDNTPNVRAEAANSVSLFGKVAISHLVTTYYKDDHWLVRASILAALTEMDCPEELLEICRITLKGEDLSLRLSAIGALASLKDTSQEKQALAELQSLQSDPYAPIRTQADRVLQSFG